MLLNKILSLFLLGSLAASLAAQPAKRVTLLSQVSYASELNDVWGYVDAAGQEYALVGLVDSVSIVSLPQGAPPAKLFSIPGVPTPWRDLKTWGEYAYVSNEGGNGILILDLGGLPGALRWKDTVMAGLQTAHNLWIEGGFLYVAGPNVFSGGVAIFDLRADPWRPAFAGSYDLRYVHDLYVRGNRGYLAEIQDGSLTVLDLADNSAPQLLGVVDYYNGATHNAWLNDAGSVCFTTDEYDGGYITSWDVSDPQNLEMLDRVRAGLSGGQASPHNVHVYQDYIVTSYYRDGLSVFDGSRPGNLVEVAWYDSSPLAGGGFNGMWGAYPFLPSGRVLGSDIENGLFVFSVQYARACYLEGSVSDAASGQPIGQVEIRLADSPPEFSRSDGSFALGRADSGWYAVSFRKYGYLPDTLLVRLDSGLVTPLSVSLTPLPRTDLQIEVKSAPGQLPVAGAEVRIRSLDGEYETHAGTAANGQLLIPDFVVNDYEVIVGKWGLRNQSLSQRIEPGHSQLSFDLDSGYYDDFSLDLGWQVSGTAQRGVWERGAPVGTFFDSIPFNPFYDLPGDIGGDCYMTGNSGGGAFADDVDNGYTLLASPPMDLSAYRHPYLHFFRWWVNWGLNGPNPDGPANDFLAVYLSRGSDTVEALRITGTFDTLWLEQAIPVEAFFPPGPGIRVLFYTQDLEPGNQDAAEAAVDGVEVKEGFPLSALPSLAPAWRAYAAAGYLNLYIPENQAFPSEVRCYDSAGRELFRAPLRGPGLQRLPFEHAAGLYVLRMPDGSHQRLAYRGR
jgi:choice-of-anchor B domain-containing protein